MSENFRKMKPKTSSHSEDKKQSKAFLLQISLLIEPYRGSLNEDGWPWTLQELITTHGMYTNLMYHTEWQKIVFRHTKLIYGEVNTTFMQLLVWAFKKFVLCVYKVNVWGSLSSIFLNHQEQQNVQDCFM